MAKFLIILSGFFFMAVDAYAQDLQRCKWISTFNDSFKIDSLTVVPNSVIVHHTDTASFNVTFDENTGAIEFSTKTVVDSVLVCYQVFPFNIHRRYFHRDLAIYDSTAWFKDPVKPNDPLLRKEELFSIDGLNKSGRISRGISFGNNQDVFVNSTLNLNMEGRLTDNLNIRAAITDQNVPFQPEGNTQQLRDFDNVFIQLYNDNFSLTGGDVVLKSRPSYFMKYHKNVQGGLAALTYNITDSIRAETSLGLSIAKGKFASVTVPPLEGVLGPYHIPGPDQNKFIIILANSEKVFLDGKPLVRGFNNDYVIDYNSAEITFTNKILITQYSRIRIDYEYSDRNYSRAIAAVTHHQEMGKLEMFINVYSEKDNKNKPLLLDLTNEDKLLLSEIGDDLDKAVASGVDSVGYNKNLILYKKVNVRDHNGAVHAIYKYSNDPDSAVFQVKFTHVGMGNGHYIQREALANGRVYEWIAPANGIPQGQYRPETNLPAPNKKQMVNIGGTYKLNNHEKVYAEMALSDHDINLFSRLDKHDNRGYAIKGGISSAGRGVTFLPEYKWHIFTDFEFNDKYFNPIDRFRHIEYNRDWGYDNEVTPEKSDDRIFNAGMGVRKDRDNGLDYSISYRKKGFLINGFQHRLALDKRLGNFQLAASLFHLKNEHDSLRSYWIRYAAEISYRSPLLVPGYFYKVDKNRVRSSITDAVVGSAMYFNEHTFYLKNGKESPVDFEIRHSVREDRIPNEGEMVDFTKANTTHFTLNKDLKHQHIALIFTYRTLNNLQLKKDEETVSGRLDWRSNWFDNHIKSDLTYAISNSRELKREFVYINVPTGQGTHTWRDLDADGLQDLDEFFEALNPDERNYAKIFVPTNEYITAFQNLLRYRITLDMPRSWRKEEGLIKFLSRFSNNTSWSADVKTTDKAIGSRLIGFAKDIEPTLLLSEKNKLRSTWFYNRTSAKYGAEITYLKSDRKQLLTGGFDARDTEEYIFSFRVNLSRNYSFHMRTATATKEVKSDFLKGRNYRIGSHKLNPEVSWQPNGNFRLSGQYGYERKKNIFTPESIEEASLDEFIINLKVNKASASTFNASLRWVEIAFNGKENTPIGYDLLNALKPGTNITWGVNWQHKVASGLQLNLSYDGRKSEGANAVHIGRVQVSALF